MRAGIDGALRRTRPCVRTLAVVVTIWRGDKVIARVRGGAAERQRKQQSKPDSDGRARPPPVGVSGRDASPGRERGRSQGQSHSEYPLKPPQLEDGKMFEVVRGVFAANCVPQRTRALGPP